MQSTMTPAGQVQQHHVIFFKLQILTGEKEGAGLLQEVIRTSGCKNMETANFLLS